MGLLAASLAAAVSAAPVSPIVAQASVGSVDGEVRFAASDVGVELAGTLTRPSSGPLNALAVLVSVAGPTDRDLTLGPHKYFRRLADALAGAGVATLRFDDRGVGGSSGTLATTDLAVRTADVCRAVATLRAAHPDVERLGVIGMSEGGGIALLANEACGPLSFAVLLSAPIHDGRTVMEGQMRRLLATAAISEERRLEIETEALRFLSLVGASDPQPNRDAILEILSGPNGSAILPPYAFVPQTPEGRTEFVLSPWYQSQVSYNVQQAARRATLPVFAVYGTLDQAIDARSNADVLRELMPAADVLMLTGLNHLMQQATTGSPLEYATLPESMSRAVLDRVVAWVAR